MKVFIIENTFAENSFVNNKVSNTAMHRKRQILQKQIKGQMFFLIRVLQLFQKWHLICLEIISFN